MILNLPGLFQKDKKHENTVQQTIEKLLGNDPGFEKKHAH